MRAHTDKLPILRYWLAITAIAAAGALGWMAMNGNDLFASDALAQQAGRSAGAAAAAPAQGGGSGYTGAASNQGGAGGLSNPSPGGDPTRYGGTDGEGQAATGMRSGYIGGRDEGGGVTPEPRTLPPLESLAARCTTNETAAAGTGQRIGSRYASAASPEMRVSGENAVRLAAASQHLNPQIASDALPAASGLMAAFQESLELGADPLLSGTYLGLVARTEVTADTVQLVSASLCVPLDNADAAAIARIAERQRQKMELELQVREAAGR